MPEWTEDLALATPDETRSRSLAEPRADTEVVVFFGTWCSDSRRELTRLWRAVEMAGGDTGFPIRYVGVDRTKTEPGDLVDGKEILYVPTLIVLKGGIEFGRIVETAPAGVESDLVALLTGEASGWLSGREDLDSLSVPAATP
jgi:thiol-disulfide isomerase/thioredoxin